MKKEVIISFSDLWRHLKRLKKQALYFSLILGGLSFAFSLFRPLTYKAHAVFKLAGPTNSAFATTLSTLMGTEKSTLAPHDDPKTLLLSSPVLEKMIKKLNLQAHPIAKKRFFGTFWDNLKLECALAKLQSQAQPSPLIPPGLPLPEFFLFPEQKENVCTQVVYTGELLTKMRIVFLDKERFAVFSHKNKIGEGRLHLPFVFAHGQFTLVSSQEEEQILLLMPLNSVVDGLKKGFKIKKNKDRPSLLNITYKHPNRWLAQKMTNGLMDAYQEFMRELNYKKGQQSLHYLSQRKAAYLQEMEEAMRSRAAYLAHHIGQGGFLSFEQEAQIMMEKQGKIVEELERVQLRQQLLKENFSAIEEKFGHFPFVERKHVEEQLALYEKEKEVQETKKNSYLRALAQEKLPSMSFVEETSLEPLYQQIDQLKVKINDQKNYSLKERDFFTQELKRSQEVLVERLHDLFAKAHVQLQLVQDKIHTLQKTELALLQEESMRLKAELEKLTLKESLFPEKWLHEKKLNLQVELIVTLMEQISKAVDARNMALHMDNWDSYPLEYASAPLLPEAPHLGFFFLGGSAAGLVFFLAALFIHHLIQGPTASVTNLKEKGLLTLGPCPQKELVEELVFHLSQKEKSTILLLNPSASFKKLFFARLDPATFFHEDLTSGYKIEELKTHIKERQAQRPWVILENNKPVQSFDNRRLLPLVDQVICSITEEKLADVALLPAHTIFIYLCEMPKPEKLYLKDIQKLLDQLGKFKTWK